MTTKLWRSHRPGLADTSGHQLCRSCKQVLAPTPNAFAPNQTVFESPGGELTTTPPAGFAKPCFTK